MLAKPVLLPPESLAEGGNSLRPIHCLSSDCTAPGISRGDVYFALISRRALARVSPTQPGLDLEIDGHPGRSRGERRYIPSANDDDSVPHRVRRQLVRRVSSSVSTLRGTVPADW
jgi:hypothetical protein